MSNAKTDAGFKNAAYLIDHGDSSYTFFTEYIKHHPILSNEETTSILRRFKYAYDFYNQMLKEKARLSAEIASTPPGLAQLELQKDYDELDRLLRESQIFRHKEKWRNKLIEHNIRLILGIAKRYTGRGLPLDDLFQAGVFGFIRAIEKFDVTVDTKLSTYATWWINQKISREIVEKVRIISLPVDIAIDTNKVFAYIRKHQPDVHLDNIDIEDIAAGTKLSVERVKKIKAHTGSFHPVNQITRNSTVTYDNRENHGLGDGTHSADHMDISFEDIHESSSWSNLPDHNDPIHQIERSVSLDKLSPFFESFVHELDPISRYVFVHALGLSLLDPVPITRLQAKLYEATGVAELNAHRIFLKTLDLFLYKILDVENYLKRKEELKHDIID